MEKEKIILLFILVITSLIMMIMQVHLFKVMKNIEDNDEYIRKQKYMTIVYSMNAIIFMLYAGVSIKTLHENMI